VVDRRHLAHRIDGEIIRMAMQFPQKALRK
jgi:hypothetical protein